ncbi:hypothetical protein GSI_07418 [Ganoderma sinense ZZ0214-1]|uniref:NAD(P)-binding protein n=1 Tax=Ganoderma sinense ZZ0214-1 TaxID=1077348 RepID=A0A2G8S8Z8_9APHY|nr:hypothetical protein GSI_07418 [Ganoderma sinense ZZ0214-1]
MPSYAVIGASRGIGIEYVRQMASRSDTVVFAVVRNPERSTHLNTSAAGLKNVHIIPGDVVDYNSLEYKVNSLGPIHAMTAFLPLLRTSDTEKIVVIGSGAGDPSSSRVLYLPHMVAYAVTKAAALLATTKFAVNLQDEGFVVITLSPGMVDCSATAGADSEALADSLKELSASVNKNTGLEVMPQTPEESVAGQLKVIDGLELSHNGLFLQHTGGEYHSRS